MDVQHIGIFDDVLTKQHAFMKRDVTQYPSGHCFYLTAVLLDMYPPAHITCVLPVGVTFDNIKEALPAGALITTLHEADDARYPLINEKVTYYICEDRHCRPATNAI